MSKYERKTLPLLMNESLNLFYNNCKLKHLSAELQDFFDSEQYKVSRKFSITTLFSQGIKYNNAIEGYNDDLEVIEDVINNIDIGNVPVEKRQRILNLYKGYQYILKKRKINKKNLKELYELLSENLIEKEDFLIMGENYRNKDVYIHYSRNLEIEPDRGVKAELIDEKMEQLFSFINDDSFKDNQIESFIKSQIIHFYFVYIHPYYDINGRTARTVAMWHLLHDNSYPFLIFNRGVILDKSRYYRIIRDVVQYNNVTFFLNYMIKVVKEELEKEYIIKKIDSKTKLTDLERQNIYNFLSFKKPDTIIDFTVIYNRFNEMKKPNYVYEKMLTPLFEKEIFLVERETKKNINGEISNQKFTFNENIIDLEESYVKKYIRK